jgi:hypothetical protein
MIPRWSLRTRMLVRLWLGGLLTANAVWIWVLVQSPAAAISLILGVGLLISGLLTRDRWKRETADHPERPPNP